MPAHSHPPARLAVVVGTQAPVSAIVYREPEADGPANDSGFTILMADGPKETLPTEDQLSTRCLACIIEAHPEAGRGLDLAQERGAAELDSNGEWQLWEQES